MDDERAADLKPWQTKRFRFWAGWALIAAAAAGFPLIVWAVESSRGDRTEAVRAHELIERTGFSDAEVRWTDVRESATDSDGQVLAVLTDPEYRAALGARGTRVCRVAGPIVNVPDAYAKATGTFTLYELPGAAPGRSSSAVVLTDSADDGRVYLADVAGPLDRSRCIG